MDAFERIAKEMGYEKSDDFVAGLSVGTASLIDFVRHCSELDIELSMPLISKINDAIVRRYGYEIAKWLPDNWGHPGDRERILSQMRRLEDER